MISRRPGLAAAAQISQNSTGTTSPGAFRYWRLFVPSTQPTGSGVNDDFSVAEVVMRSSIGGTNESVGKTYASSSEFDASNDAAKAFDGNSNTQLATVDSTDAWVSVDFGAGNALEIQEIVYTSRANFSRQQPSEIRVQYSSDNVTWFLAWIITPVAWGNLQEVRTFTAPYASSLFPVSNYVTISDSLNCVGAWGTILRNYAYTGPALRVEDNANPGTTTDVSFNAFGLLTGALPYGDDTRVVTIYDQVGNTDLFATLADDVQLNLNDLEYGTWQIVLTGNGGFTSTNVAGGGHAWEIGDPVWTCSAIRNSGTGFRPIWGIRQASSVLEVGVVQDAADLAWRVNGSNTGDWGNTDYFLNDATVRGKVDRCIGDCSAGSPATAYYKGATADSLSYTAPIVYNAGEPIYVGTGVSSNDFIGSFFELAIFQPLGFLQPGDVAKLDDALKETEFFVTAERVQAHEERLHILLGSSLNTLATRQHRAYVAVGPKFSSANAHTQQTFAVMGNSPQTVATKQQRIYAIIVP